MNLPHGNLALPNMDFAAAPDRAGGDADFGAGGPGVSRGNSFNLCINICHIVHSLCGPGSETGMATAPYTSISWIRFNGS
jgi:hypothetical protein